MKGIHFYVQWKKNPSLFLQWFHLQNLFFCQMSFSCLNPGIVTSVDLRFLPKMARTAAPPPPPPPSPWLICLPVAQTRQSPLTSGWISPGSICAAWLSLLKKQSLGFFFLCLLPQERKLSRNIMYLLLLIDVGYNIMGWFDAIDVIYK